MAGNVLSSLLDRAAALVAHKKELALEIKGIALAQSAFLAPEQAEELLGLIKKRQGFIDEVDRIDMELARLDEEIKNAQDASGQADLSGAFAQKREKIKELQEEVGLIMEEAWKLDGQNRQKIDEEYGKLKSSAKFLCAGKKSAAAYQGAAGQFRGCFIDKRK